MDKLNGWPPSLPEFISLGREQVDYTGAFYRCLNRDPQGRAEQFVYENSAFNIRRMTQKESERFHKAELDKAINLEARGLLRLNSDMPIGIAQHSTVNLNDIERENHKGKQHKFSDRINALRKGK
tara:strand:- start:39 stop:413 length:375 start_codon:yes stop_codon:yes gene_type:complete